MYSSGLSFESVALVIDFISHISREVLIRLNRSSARAVWLAKAMRILSCSWVMMPSGS